MNEYRKVSVIWKGSGVLMLPFIAEDFLYFAMAGLKLQLMVYFYARILQGSCLKD